MILTVIDLETTGKLDPKHKIIELSCRVCDFTDKRSLKEISAEVMRFNPERNIDAAAQAVHGIPLIDLKHEPKFIERADEVISLINKSDYLVGHNLIGFDWPFLKQEIESTGKVCPEPKLFDTMLEGNFATFLGKNPTLKELCWSLDVVFDSEQAHKADYDTAVLRDALFNGYRLGWFELGKD